MTTPIDLSLLPAPQVVEPLDYEQILAEMVADLQARDPDFDALVESDPAHKVLQVAAYREILIRQRVNDSARAVMLAYAEGSDLEHLAALYGVERLLIDAGDPAAIPPVPPTWESDDALRRRAQLAPEAQTTAGSRGGYVFHSLSASPLVKDVDVQSPAPGEVLVTVLSTEGDGAPDQSLLDAVHAALSAETVRPLTDLVSVQGAEIVPYEITAAIWVDPGPDAEVVRQAAQDAALAYAAQAHRMGRTPALSGVYAALHQPGVSQVTLIEPADTLAIERHQAAYCTAVTVTLGGADA